MATTTAAKAAKTTHPMQDLLDKLEFEMPKAGQMIDVKVVSVKSNEIYVDIGGYLTGVIRGWELEDESGIYDTVKVGDEITAKVIDLDNERGEVEMSVREAGHIKAWEELTSIYEDKKTVDVEIADANKGGLMVKFNNTKGFMPVSQLTTEHYPRVQGGDKGRILDKLKSYVGQKFQARIIDLDEKADKLIFSEKAAWAEEQQKKMANYKVGDTVEGKVSGVVNFGAFVEFGEQLEGLVHISEIDWKRIDDPSDYLKVGEKVQAKIIGIDPNRISLSIKALKTDPWQDVDKKFSIGQKVKGEILKVNEFGLFIQLDESIHGLAHMSELDKGFEKKYSAGDKGDFYIISIEPRHHRLGLSAKPQGGTKVTSEKKEEAKEDKPESKDAEKAEEKVEVKEEKVEEKE